MAAAQSTCTVEEQWSVIHFLWSEGLKPYAIYKGHSKINLLQLAGKKKYKTENKTLLQGTVTYISALLLHIVAIHI